VQQCEHARVGKGDSQGEGSGDRESDYKCNQQTSQVWPTFPSIPAATGNGLNPAHLSIFFLRKKAKKMVQPGALPTLPALTLAAVNK
jgi:hypothetical protein